uniref:Putative leucine-rich repeat protein n=1 Tax=Culex tarsalis TaxID=7177 RepID=A0A1Q3FPH6_CULTA
MCFLNSLSYNPQDHDVIHLFPANLTHVRLGVGVTLFEDFETEHFDAKLYGMMGRPPVLEVFNLWVKTVELPRTVRHADFRKNLVEMLSVEPGEDVPSIAYLNLDNNDLSSIANVRVLINLEVLLLNNNNIKHIDPATMKNLTKLRILDLSRNYIRQFSTEVFPRSLTHLNLYANKLTSLNYVNMYFPSLESLTLERNRIASIDASAMVLAMPKLRVARVGGNPIDPVDFRRCAEQFRRYNVDIGNEVDEEACLSKEQLVEGVCLVRLKERSAVWKVGLSLMVILVLIAMILIVWQVFLGIKNK